MKKRILSLSFLLLSLWATAQEDQTTKNDSVKKLQEVIINGNTHKYKREKSTTVAKMPLKNIENPQVYNTVTSELIKEQVATSFHDALKNASGVTRVWESTGRGGDGGEFYILRGFPTQPTMVNGFPAINNGTIDPINVDNIEVIKGPSGALYGSSLISYGGLINVVTKKPFSKFGGEIGYNAGTYGMDRVTADVNVPINKDVDFRLNTAYQQQNTFQDAGFGKSLLIAPSLNYRVNDRLSFLISSEFYDRKSAYAPMFFLNRYAPLSFDRIDLFEQNYRKSYTSNELSISNPTYNLQAQMLYKLSDKWSSQTVLSRSNSKTNGYYSYLWDSSNGDEFTRYIAKLNGQTVTTDIQQNFIGDFNIGKLRNRVLLGFDYYRQFITSGNTGYVGNGTVSVVNQTDNGDLTQAGVDDLLIGSFAGNSTSDQQIISVYAADVLNITDKLSVMASVRFDNFKGQTAYWVPDAIKSQNAVSPKFGIVYQIIENKVSVFGNYMNGFKNVNPSTVYDIDGNNPQLKSFDPEHANQLEVGFKTNLYKEIISASISYYDINVKNKVMTDPENQNSSIQGAEVNSKGVEFNLTANPMKGLNIIAGYGFNDSKVVKDYEFSGYLGLRPEDAGAKHIANLWTNYTVMSGTLKGIGFGFGGNYASEHKTLNRSNIGTFKLPAYTIFNAALSYNTEKFNITVKANNLENEKYYTGWSTVSPQNLRSVTAGLTYKF